MRTSIIIGVCCATVVMVGFVCGADPQAKESHAFHEKFGWKAEDYFDDPQIVSLCKAIEADDLDAIDRLVKGGADVNATGKGGMTPLLWSFPDNKLARFTRMLEHGASPNVFTTSDCGTRGAMGAGSSITHMACKTEFPGYFEAVFKHGGDPNLVAGNIAGFKGTPLFAAIFGSATNKTENVRSLIKLGSKLNHIDSLGQTPVIRAASFEYFEIALVLLEAGADYRYVDPHRRGQIRLVHVVREQLHKSKSWPPRTRKDYEALVAWLESRGESLDKAQRELDDLASKGG